MSPGHILFYCGAGLLGFTVILALVFLIWRPKYRPENVVYQDAESGETQRLRNGYPTDPSTRRRTTASSARTQRSTLPQTQTMPVDPQAPTELTENSWRNSQQ